MVEEEVYHLASVGKDSEEAKQRGATRAAPEGVETCEEAAGAEGLAGEAGGDLPVLGAAGEVRAGGLRVPMNELGDVLEGLDELVDAIALREEDDELVDGVVHVEVRKGEEAALFAAVEGVAASLDNGF